MDNSETYIKMCKKAEEIQRFGRNDFTSLGVVDSFFELVAPFECRCGKYAKERYKGIICDKCRIIVGQRVWLPRQDQLQEMLLTNNLPDELCKIMGYFNDFILRVTPQFGSYEQLWLAFVMLTLYHKKWYNGDWKTLDKVN